MGKNRENPLLLPVTRHLLPVIFSFSHPGSFFKLKAFSVYPVIVVIYLFHRRVNSLMQQMRSSGVNGPVLP
ncbi:MAG: hypothetical protein H6Q52_1414 [Deltaproteobacteria bacterium]|nr:hypothetical protein [Deltaproteobacteria bacterium]